MPGGVADYTRIVAVGLAAAGEAVTVWTPAGCDGSVVDAGVEVRRLPDHFGRAGRATMDAGIPAGSRVLVQYVPHAFGAKSMNVPLAGWLWRRRRRWAIDVMFHEVAMPFGVGQPLHHNIPAAAHRMMARLLVSAADRVFVSTSAWNRLIRPRRREPIVCPVFSNVTPPRDPVAARDRMRHELGLADDAMLLGHFGACLMIEHLAAAVESAMSSGSSARFIFIGGGSTGAGEAVRRRMPAGRERVIVTGGVGPGGVFA